MLDLREPHRSIRLKALKVCQPIGDFYLAVIGSSALYEIAKFDVRRLTQRQGIDDFLGIQREVSSSRLKELKTYISSPDATFPTSIVVSIDERCAKFVENELGCGELVLSNYIDPEDKDLDILYQDIAKIIDGQHRIKAFEDGHNPNFILSISVFIGADIATQAEIFSTVNLAQTKVNRSLVYDLFSLAKTRSPEKTAHEITVLLDSDEGSPFFRRIKRLGVATEGRYGEVLSQATVVRGILMLITRDAYTDRLTGKRERIWASDRNEDSKYIFRQFFIEGNDDIIYINMINYFNAVRELWPLSWSGEGRGNILPRTNGYIALMRFLRIVYSNAEKSEGVVSTQKFTEALRRTHLSDGDFVATRFVPGTGGETALFRALKEGVS
ncbi:DGQHR domain-containing protein [Prosthecodimorpha staleyi]|uniref:DGQHR domain-containing protein n=1 Tax=Prosthecodimorpha staleyi TaxID=2840188 RepID=A0A947GEH2_9HYPH|nr:DGQHR domain-containing protein [Prosthecodimorpha staleyi]MBT9291947.1 DGQHR domain-containing protein [Prosthecodimorpha staleyi]